MQQRLPSLLSGDVGRWRYTSPFHRGISGTAMLPYVCTRYRQSGFTPRREGAAVKGAEKNDELLRGHRQLVLQDCKKYGELLPQLVFVERHGRMHHQDA